MHGIKPKKAHAAAAQNFADGGMVSRLKGALGFKPADPEREKRLADYRAGRELEKQQAKAAAAQPAPAAPQLQKAISSYAAGSALEERMRKAGAYAGGGMVRGPGTGTSDEVPAVVPEGTYIMPADSTRSLGAKGLASMGAPGVPVNLSNGEFKMPPEQVHAVGVQALDQMKGATHTPVQPQQARGMKPELFFANGGVVEDEENAKRFAKVPEQFGRRGNSFGDAAAAAADPSVAQVKTVVPAAPAPAMSAAAPTVASPNQTSPSNAYPQSSPSAGANVYGGAGMARGTSGLLATGAERVIAAQPPRPQAPVVQPRPAPPTGAQIDGMVNQIPRDVGPRPAMQQAVQMPQQAAPAAPARAGWQNDLASLQQQNVSPAPAAPAPAIPATQVEGWRTKAVMDGAAQDAQAAWDRGGAEGVAGAAGAVARGAITAIPTAVGEFAYNTVAPLGGVAKGFWNGLTGGADQSAPAQAAAGVRGLGVPAAAAASPAPVAPAGRPQAVAAPTQPGQQPPPPQAPAQPPAAGPTEIMPGVFRQGNSYADSVAGLSGAYTAPPPTQSMAVGARGLAGQAPAAPQQVSAPQIATSANNWQARNDLRNARVSANSITANGGRFDSNKGPSPERQAYAAMLGNDLQLRGAQPGADQAAMRENGANNRAFMQDQSALARTQLQESGANQREGGRNALAQQQMSMAQQAQGFQNRLAAQSEQLRNTLLDPAATPEQRKIAQRSLSILSGKTAADRMQTVNLPDTTNEMGGTVRGGQALVRTLEDGTVEQVPIGAQSLQGAAQAIPAGALEALKKDPKLAQFFDQKYGPGAAARALGR